MSALTFSLKLDLRHDLDLSPLTPDRLEGKNQKQIKRIQLSHGKSKLALEEVFDIKGTDHTHIKIKKCNPKLMRIGQDMTQGRIEIKGNTGDYLGERLSGGEITVTGSAGNWSGANMNGGRIRIKGNAGDFIGAALPGDKEGMSGGLITINGDCGERVGDRMRRGIIIISGDAGDYCGSRMVAGTILILGRAGRHVGYNMKRGTILLSKKPKQLAATFNSCGNLIMPFTNLLFNELGKMGLRYPVLNKRDIRVHRFGGGLAHKGKGEIILLHTINIGNKNA